MINFYETHHAEYFERTAYIDPSSFLGPFVQMLPKNATCFDVGCGSGRDLLWLKQQGFKPMGLEGSQSLARIASSYAKCPVMNEDFETIDFSSLSFDAVLAVGSLVHIPHERLEGVLKNLFTAINDNGLAYVSLKSGEGTRTDDFGRTFYLWDDDDLRDVFKSLGFKVMSFSRSESVQNSKDEWMGFGLKQKKLA